MKKLFGLFILASVILTLGIVSAEESCNSQTVVGGTIYQNTVENGIVGAEVWVTCNEHTKFITSIANGAYSVNFDCSECALEDTVYVHATKGSLTGDNSGDIDMTFEIPCGIELDVGIVNVPLVPEFGVIVGIVTALGALGVFFIVRRK